MNELQKTIDMLQQENSELKVKIRDINHNSEQEKQEILLNERELELNFKQQKVNFESEKLQLLGAIQKLESEIFKLSNSAKLKTFEKETVSESQKNQINGLQKQFLLEKEALIKENTKIREDSEKSLIELKSVYESENESLRNTVKDLQKRIRQQQHVIDELKEQTGEVMENRNEELECQVEYYKELYLNTTKNTTSRKNISDSAEKQKYLDSIESLNIQKDKLQLEIEKLQLEVKKLKLDINRNQEKYWENERNLKNEIKILIGKLMKAKSKLESEVDYNDTLKKDLSYTNRSSSSNRPRNNTSNYY